MKKTYLAVGDIHGCWRELDLLVEQIGKTYDLNSPENIMVFLGDYIDRGESSYFVLQRLMKLQKQFPHFVFLMGNHEHMYLKQSDAQRIRLNDEHDLPAKVPTEMLEFLKNLKPYHETEAHLFVHGGPELENSDLETFDLEYLLWNYYPSPRGWRNKTIVRGHLPCDVVTQNGKVLSVDTGCCYGRILSCAVITDDEGLKQVITVEKLARADHEEVYNHLNDEAKSLADAYCRTTFRVDSPIGTIDIQIGRQNEKLDQLLTDHKAVTGCFVTAYNPFSKSLSELENELNHMQMITDFNSLKFTYFMGEGVPADGNWQPEKSALVLNMSIDEAVGLGNAYSQNAIVFVVKGQLAKLYWCKIPH